MRGFRFQHHHLLILVWGILLFAALNKNSGKKIKTVIYADVEGYYSYLPGVFIEKDLTGYPYWKGSHRGVETKLGYKQIKYTYGVALFYLPFFLIAHLISLVGGYEANGFTDIYRYAVVFCGVFYAGLGILLLKKTLQFYFKPGVVWLTILCIVFGTNYYYYSIDELGMSHVYSFLLFASFVYLTSKVLETPNWKNVLLISAVFGWIVLIRPVNGIIIFYLLLYGVFSITDLKERFTFLLTKPAKMVAAAAVMITFLSPQILYWSYLNGELTLWSYGDQGFTNWDNPQILNVLFNVQNGLFIYSPIVLFAVGGIFIALKKRHQYGIPALILFCLATYIFASWWAWWFGGAFGHRCYVEFYALLALPLGLVVSHIVNLKNVAGKISLAVLGAALLYYNIKLTYLYRPPWDGADWNWDAFLKVLSKLI